MTMAFMVIGLLGLIMINVPIAVALGAITVVAMVTTQGMWILPNVGLVMYDGATSFPLLAIPMFILAGAIMNATGISRRLIAFASALFGFIRGGLSMVSIGASLFFAEISGSAVADVAAMGSILIPAMKKKKYPRALAAAVTSSSAATMIRWKISSAENRSRMTLPPAGAPLRDTSTASRTASSLSLSFAIGSGFRSLRKTSFVADSLPGEVSEKARCQSWRNHR